MSKPRPKMKSKHRGCTGKQRFETLDSATRAARAASTRHEFQGAYRCNLCKGYHYGHPSLPR